MYYPIYLDLRGRACLVVGGGSVAAGKVRGLLEAGARVTIVAPVAVEPITTWSAQGWLVWHAREFQPSDLSRAFLVVAATDDHALNAVVYNLADSQSRLANAVDDLDHCNFIAPAVASAGAIQVAVSTSGKSPALAKQLRDEIAQQVLTPARERLADFLGAWRDEVKHALPTYPQRMAFWEGVLRSEIPQLLDRDDTAHTARAEEVMRELIAQAAAQAASSRVLPAQVEARPDTPRDVVPEGVRMEGH
jgi:siroheme synthase-like protein